MTIVERGPAAMPHHSRLPRIALLDRLMAHGVAFCPDMEVVRLLPNGVVAEGRDGASRQLPADTVILANGRKGDETILDQFSEAAPTVTAIGGCSRAVSLRECIHGGFFAGKNIEYF